MNDPALGINDAAALIAQEVEGAGLGHIAASVGMGGIAGSVVCQRVQRAAVDHAVGIQQIRASVHAETGVVGLGQLHRHHVAVEHKGILGIINMNHKANLAFVI